MDCNQCLFRQLGEGLNGTHSQVARMKSGANTVDDAYTSTLVRTTGDTWFYDTTVTPGRTLLLLGQWHQTDMVMAQTATQPGVFCRNTSCCAGSRCREKQTYSDRIPISWGSMEGGAYESLAWNNRRYWLSQP